MSKHPWFLGYETFPRRIIKAFFPKKWCKYRGCWKKPVRGLFCEWHIYKLAKDMLIEAKKVAGIK